MNDNASSDSDIIDEKELEDAKKPQEPLNVPLANESPFLHSKIVRVSNVIPVKEYEEDLAPTKEKLMHLIQKGKFDCAMED